MIELQADHIQYVGSEGISRDCSDAVLRILQFGDRVGRAHILTSDTTHTLLLEVNDRHVFAVKSGFKSGYSGESPKTLSWVLRLLEAHGADIEEYEVPSGMLDRLNRSALRPSDCKWLEEARPVRPLRWRDYIFARHEEAARSGKIWDHFSPVIPFAIVDPRLVDVALTFFDDPDAALMTGYRRLEDAVRSRSGQMDHGSRLFSAAFNPEGGKLTWEGLPPAEQRRRGDFFSSAYGVFRNVRAHKERMSDTDDLLTEFLVLNALYRLEREAILRTSDGGG